MNKPGNNEPNNDDRDDREQDDCEPNCTHERLDPHAASSREEYDARARTLVKWGIGLMKDGMPNKLAEFFQAEGLCPICALDACLFMAGLLAQVNDQPLTSGADKAMIALGYSFGEAGRIMGSSSEQLADILKRAGGPGVQVMSIDELLGGLELPPGAKPN